MKKVSLWRIVDCLAPIEFLNKSELIVDKLLLSEIRTLTFHQLTLQEKYVLINPIIWGWSYTPYFMRGDKFVLHPRNTKSLEKKW